MRQAYDICRAGRSSKIVRLEADMCARTSFTGLGHQFGVFTSSPQVTVIHVFSHNLVAPIVGHLAEAASGPPPPHPTLHDVAVEYGHLADGAAPEGASSEAASALLTLRPQCRRLGAQARVLPGPVRGGSEHVRLQ